MQNEPPKAETPKGRRRWLQFSLRTLMIGVTVVAVGAWYVVSQDRIVQQRKVMLEDIKSHGGRWFSGPGRNWFLRRWLSDEWIGGIDMPEGTSEDYELKIKTFFPEADVIRPPQITISKLPEIGDILRDLPKSRVSELVFSAQFEPAYYAELSGITYTIAVSRQSGKVQYISTKNKGFRTPEGLSVENTVGDLLDEYPDDECEDLGWGVYVLLPSGWNAYAGLKGTFNAKSRIKAFFKRSDSWE